MLDVIVIYADCTKQNAKGDFVFAGNIARDLSHQLKACNSSISVILASSANGFNTFESLYGKTVDGCIEVEGERISLYILQQLDPSIYHVITFIEANRCEYAPAEMLKRVVSPDSKFLFIGAPNQPQVNAHVASIYYDEIFKEQPNIYHYFDAYDILIDASGIGQGRAGLASISDLENIPQKPSQYEPMLKTIYGFMYLSAVQEESDLSLIVQYLKLTNLDHYVLVGDFLDKKIQIQATFFKNTDLKTTKRFPKITCYKSLDNYSMRKIASNAACDLVLSTGTMSTLEIMHDKKIPFYQNRKINAPFVISYLAAVRSLTSNDSSLTACMIDLIIELSDILFTPKPLQEEQMQRASSLLAMEPLRKKLVQTNHKIVAHANGKLASRLLMFINQSNVTSLDKQISSVCQFLRLPGEMVNPSLEKALQRAAAGGHLFELKVLIRAMSIAQLTKKDSIFNRTALHWATLHNHIECVSVLIAAGCDPNQADRDNQTVLDYALSNNSAKILQILQKQEVCRNFKSA